MYAGTSKITRITTVPSMNGIQGANQLRILDRQGRIRAIGDGQLNIEHTEKGSQEVTGDV